MPIMNGRDHLEAQKHIPAMIGQVIILIPMIQLNIQLCLNLFMSQQTYRIKSLSVIKTTILVIRLFFSRDSFHPYVFKAAKSSDTGFIESRTFSSVNSMKLYCLPQHIINHGWKYILQNQPHDSITVVVLTKFIEMEVRHDKQDKLVKPCFTKLFSQLYVEEEVADDIKECWLAVFNPSLITEQKLLRAMLICSRLHCYYLMKNRKECILMILWQIILYLLP